MLKRLKKRETRGDTVNAERIWTFLIACGYASKEEEGIAILTRILTGAEQPRLLHPRVWFEAMPRSPRRGEKTKIDLAVGTIKQRNRFGSSTLSKSGIELDDSAVPWVCFCEMKWKSEMSLKITGYDDRNQLARDIENALCIHNSSQFADGVFFVTVTSPHFGVSYPKLKEQFLKYQTTPDLLIHELSHYPRAKNAPYPENIAKRVQENLQLRCETFESLIEGLPKTEIADAIKAEWMIQIGTEKWRNGTLGRNL